MCLIAVSLGKPGLLKTNQNYRQQMSAMNWLLDLSYRCTEDTVAALQLSGGCRRLLAEAQLAENLWSPVGLSTDLRGPRCWIPSFLPQGGTPAGHVGARDAGRGWVRNQAAPNPSSSDCEELQHPFMFLEAETVWLCLSLQQNTPRCNSSHSLTTLHNDFLSLAWGLGWLHCSPKQ